ncbi:hypothetical protein L484_003568 [Morus notabilis]|uniref:Uncharacterized protein n=1 Tax=Morus notabilis TaxID=981085 RepID=W9RDG5_9ROSA|nr:hypothetical protein L484_003568 [Morus notabilis]
MASMDGRKRARPERGHNGSRMKMKRKNMPYGDDGCPRSSSSGSATRKEVNVFRDGARCGVAGGGVTDFGFVVGIGLACGGAMGLACDGAGLTMDSAGQRLSSLRFYRGKKEIHRTLTVCLV